MKKLVNRIALITGASSGIGEATSQALASEGCNLILIARREERLAELSESIITEYGVKVYTIAVDVTDRTSFRQSIEQLPEDWQAIDILVNNAGKARGFDHLAEGNVDNWDEMIDTNVKGVLNSIKIIVPLMKKRKTGHVVHLGSTAGREVYANGGVYCATKYAVKAINQALRIELLEHNIKVSTVDPGMVETEFSIVRFNGNEERAKKVYEGIDPLRAVDVADAIVYCVTRPAHVNISEILITPTQQATSTKVFRKN